ncbi:MAG: sulfatase-like hydrolase/transferase, partial [Cyclobacteriaceae bacterium]|nr:sulfatase-like hydrolase/transferase [Cyclobacteriaceae bacterium]
YGGLVESMDDAIGVVLDAIKDLGLEENTIVVFTSDNGGVSSGDAFSTSNLPFKGGKGYQWEGGIREPYFVKVPWLPTAGKVTEEVASGVDFYPTLLELAGLALIPEQHVDGLSLVPVLNGEKLPERPLYWHYPHYGNQGGQPSSIIRLGDWKLIHYWEDDREELYNVTEDMTESKNLAAENPEKVKELSDMLLGWLKEVDANMARPDTLYDETLAKEWYDNIVNNRWPKLEEQRLRFLEEDFEPNEDWWGSKVTVD